MKKYTSFLPRFIHLAESAIKHEAPLFAVEYATHTYLYVACNANELSLEILWDKPLIDCLPWQPLRLHGIAAHQFWQVLELTGYQKLDYQAAQMPENDLPLNRLTAAAHFRKRHGLGERGRWAMLTDTDLTDIQQLLATYPADSQLFSLMLTEIDLPELGKLAHQLAQWQNDDLEAEVATATQWMQQEQTAFLPYPIALAALGRFTWFDGISVKQLNSLHIRPRRWRAIMAWLPVNPTEPIPIQIRFHDARLPEASSATGHELDATKDFCQAYGYAALTCRAESREWITANGQRQTDESGATAWVIDAWQLPLFSITGTQPPESAYDSLSVILHYLL